MDSRLYVHLERNVSESASYLVLLAGKTSFTERYATPSRSPTLICLPFLCHFGLQESRNLRLEYCNSDEALNYNFKLWVTSSHKRRASGAREARLSCHIRSLCFSPRVPIA